MPRLSIDLIGLAAALVATVVMYVFFIVHPQNTPLVAFLAMFERGNAAVWPMQLVWYASAAAIVGLALWPIRRASQLICLLAAAYLAWVGIAYFGVLFSGTHVAWVPGSGPLPSSLRRSYSWSRASCAATSCRSALFPGLGAGAVFILYTLVAYPIIGLLGGQPLGSLPVFGLAPCPTVIFAFGLLLWARPPSPKYLLLIPLAWGLGAGPGGMATGIVVTSA